jgi:hypothetical protein
MDRKLREEVSRRANGQCEYCHLRSTADVMPFQVDHIIAEYHGGQTAFENIAWSCYDCNVFKGANLAGIDPVDGSIVRLFNPRGDRWDEHFLIDGSGEMKGLTSIGRSTVATLRMNLQDRVDHRRLISMLE